MTVFHHLIGIVGIAFLLGVAYLFSNNRKAIRWKIVVGGLAIEFLFLFLILHTSPGMWFFNFLSDVFSKVMSFSYTGIQFIFGPLFSNFAPNYPFIFQALMPIIFFGSLMSVLYHFRIMQKVVHVISVVFTKVMGLSSAESVGVASNVFLGQTQAPLVILPYLKGLTQSELFLTMVGGMATVAGPLLFAYAQMGANLSYVLAASVMAAPGAIIFAKIMFPEAGEPETLGANLKGEDKPETKNVLDAIAVGAMDGWKITVGVMVMLLSFVAFIYFFNYLILFVSFHKVSLDMILGWVFSPVAYVIGVPVNDIHAFSILLGQKTMFNEFIAYGNLHNFHLSKKAFIMVCFVLTGFANFSSIAIQIGGIGELAPSRRSEIVAFGLKALLAAILANLLSATIAGLMFFG